MVMEKIHDSVAQNVFYLTLLERVHFNLKSMEIYKLPYVACISFQCVTSFWLIVYAFKVLKFANAQQLA